MGGYSCYLELISKLPTDKVPYISATTIAQKLRLGKVQVRKDLASVSSAGKPKLVYSTEELKEISKEVLRYDRLTSAVLIGAGKLGRVLLQFSEFGKYGAMISAAFDSNENL